MRVAVTGVNGFVGVHLVRELVDHGHDVVGLSMGSVDAEVADLLADYVEGDLAAGWPAPPADAIVHLAGLSSVGPSFADPQRYLEANSAPVTYLCESILADRRRPRLLVVSTGAVYAPGTGLDEDAPIQASSPYVVSKLLVEAQSAYYRHRGLDITVLRPFNHIGPGQAPGFVLPDLIRAVGRGTVVAGNLQTRRDYTDVRDIARAYRLAVEADRVGPSILNVCSGRSISGSELLDLVIKARDVPMPHVEVDPSQIRPGDPAEISGSHARITDTLGWQPCIAVATSVWDAIAATPY